MKISVTIRFYEELNDCLASGIRKQDRFMDIEKGLSIGNLFGSLGVKCAAVDLILVNGQSANFDYILRNNDRVSIYPVFEKFNIKSVSALKHSPLRALTFICDVHLGRLAKYLRMLGFDTLHESDYDDNHMIQLSNSLGRILLSRDRNLILNKQLTRRYLVAQTSSTGQIREVLEFFDLKQSILPMSRCLKCNGLVNPVGKESVKHRVAPLIFDIIGDFTECSGCGRIYWKGSHYGSMMKRIREILD